jgi:hypothetical protein
MHYLILVGRVCKGHRMRSIWCSNNIKYTLATLTYTLG